jgi:hypothetical protein
MDNTIPGSGFGCVFFGGSDKRFTILLAHPLERLLEFEETQVEHLTHRASAYFPSYLSGYHTACLKPR